jgi:hypothetical protein
MSKISILITALFAALLSPAYAEMPPPLLVDSPCGWFVKTAPEVWSTNRIVRVDTWGLVNGLLSFGPGAYRVDDGTDAYEFIERKCGHGVPPRAAYRSAMPLPFALLPWYR